jgi:hypothetical protein
MAMGFSCRVAQPIIGSHRSSRLSTHDCGGKITICAIVSQAEECFPRLTWQPAGIRSEPSTV